MAMQEDYLDGLLKGLSRELEELEIEQRELAAASEDESGIEGESVFPEEPIIEETPELSLTQEAPDLMEAPELSLTQAASDLMETPELSLAQEASDLVETPELSLTQEAPDLMEAPELSLAQEASDLMETLGELEGLERSELPEESIVQEEPVITEEPVTLEESEMTDEPIIAEEPELFSQEEADLLETLEGLEEAGSPKISEEPEIPQEPIAAEAPELSLSQEETDLLETLGKLDDDASPEVPGQPAIPEYKEELEISDTLDSSENSVDSGGSGDDDFVDFSEVSSMSEEEIEKLLAAGREVSEDSNKDVSEDLGDDIVDILAVSDDSELKEIQNLLEKSDNNEAVADEIESLLQGVEQENSIPVDLLVPDGTANAAGKPLSPRQQKALEKRLLKEKAAAAKKAKKEAKKAEKKTKKAGKQDGETLDVDKADGAFVNAEESVDTSLLDSILSEAGKINGNETNKGNNNAKVEGGLKDQLNEDADGASVEDAEGLGLDLDSLFSDDNGAEAPVEVDGEESEFPDFVALDGDDVAGIAELTGEDVKGDKPKKKGFWARLMEFLMQDDEDEEEDNEDEKTENENIQLSEENRQIINDLDKEKAKNKKDKKAKKGKGKAKKADASTEEGGEDEEEDAKKDKKKKEKKPKKEKPPKEVEQVDPRKQLTLKKMMPIILFCLSLGVAIIIFTNLSVDFSDKKAAREAYYSGDYRTCYLNLYGKELNESDQVMLGKSECILTIRLWIREYEMYAEEGSSLEALDCLIQAVNDYPDLYEYASKWNAAGDVTAEYTIILNLLYERYGLTEDQARAIAAEPNDIEYTKQVNAIVQGGAYGSWNQPEPIVDAPLTDVLPEEEELPDGNLFIETNTSAR